MTRNTEFTKVAKAAVYLAKTAHPAGEYHVIRRVWHLPLSSFFEAGGTGKNKKQPLSCMHHALQVKKVYTLKAATEASP